MKHYTSIQNDKLSNLNLKQTLSYSTPKNMLGFYNSTIYHMKNKIKNCVLW